MKRETNRKLGFLNALDDSQLVDWVARLIGVYPPPVDLSTPPDYVDDVGYIITVLTTRNQMALARRVGDAAAQLLLTSANPEPGSVKTDLPIWLFGLLRLLAALPVSHPSSVVRRLDELLDVKALRDWPSAAEDCHRQVLFALNQHADEPSGRISHWVNRLDKDTANPVYAVAAFGVLLKQAPAAAVNRLPAVLDLLQIAGISSDMVLLSVARRTNADQKLWSQVERYIPARIAAAARSNSSGSIGNCR